MAGACELPTASGPRARFRRRSSAERLVVLAVAVLVFRTWLVEGLFVPFQVASGSMADTLRGPHRQVVCTECGSRFACDLGPARSRAVCPNCGCWENDLAGQPEVDGDRVLVDKLVYRLRPPRRWELVALRDARCPSRILVKRVVGLPGESIQIRRGEVYVEGTLQRKSLAQQRALAVVVHDADHPSRNGPPPGWGDDRAGAAWPSTDGRFVHPSIPGATSIDWLAYRHGRRTPGLPDPAQETPITNQRGYNQGRQQRAENVHPMVDLRLSFRVVRTWGEGRLLVRATDGEDEFQLRIEPHLDRYEVHRNGLPLEPSPPPNGRRLPRGGGELLVEVSLVDQQFLLAFDGRPAMVFPKESPGARAQPTPRPFAIGAQGLGVELRALRVYRDVYYTHPVGVLGRWGLKEPFRLGPDEYFVLGDNSLISDDSRTWADVPAVPGHALVGRPFLVHFPARRVELGPWDIQVPDPSRIRYIR